MNNKNKSVGSELTERLRRFTEKLDSIDSVSQLPEILTVRKVKLNLQPRSFGAHEVRAIRDDLRVSQAVLAEFLGISAATLRDWEQGISEPNGPVCRILEEMHRDVSSWAKRIRELSNVTATC